MDLRALGMPAWGLPNSLCVHVTDESVFSRRSELRNRKSDNQKQNCFEVKLNKNVFSRLNVYLCLNYASCEHHFNIFFCVIVQKNCNLKFTLSM